MLRKTKEEMEGEEEKKKKKSVCLYVISDRFPQYNENILTPCIFYIYNIISIVHTQIILCSRLSFLLVLSVMDKNTTVEILRNFKQTQ